MKCISQLTNLIPRTVWINGPGNEAVSWHTHTLYCNNHIQAQWTILWGVGVKHNVHLPADIELQGQAWYHGWISQETAEERLDKVPYHCFLIRENGATGRTLSLSMKYQGEISHFLIVKDAGRYEITANDRKFATLVQLVDFYMTNSISSDLTNRLGSPCPQPSPDGECNGDHDSWPVSGDSIPHPFSYVDIDIKQWESRGRHH